MSIRHLKWYGIILKVAAIMNVQKRIVTFKKKKWKEFLITFLNTLN